MNAASDTRRLVLVGAGHTHLHVVCMWRDRPIPRTELTVISAFDRATYSGMLPGTLAGLYRQEQMEIHLPQLCNSAGVQLIVDEAIGLDPNSRKVTLRDGKPIDFDVASIGIGSVPSWNAKWQQYASVLSIKPMATFLARLNARLEDRRQSADQSSRAMPLYAAIIGGGAAGVEIAFCLEALLQRRRIDTRLVLCESGRQILDGYSKGTVRRAVREFQRRGIALHLGSRAAAYRDGEQPPQLELSDGSSIPADLVIWAAGAAPPPVLENFDLPKSDDGFLAVRPTLQSTGAFPVFVVGDTATLVDNPVPKAGVYAVREAPILWHNLNNLLAGKPLASYRPQHGFLSLLSTGDRRALLEYRGVSSHSRWAWWLKDWIDRRFMAKHGSSSHSSENFTTETRRRRLPQR